MTSSGGSKSYSARYKRLTTNTVVDRRAREWRQQWCKEVKICKGRFSVTCGLGETTTALFNNANAIIDQRTQLNNSPDIALTGIDHGQLCSTTHKTREEEKGLWGNCKRFICTQQSTSVNRRAFVSYPESASPRAVDSGSWIELI